MNERKIKATGLKERADTTKQQLPVEPPDLFIRQIEERAFTQTQVLIEVLEREDRAHWRHWGINE